MIILISLTVVTLYALLVTIKLAEVDDYANGLERLLDIQSKQVEAYKNNSIDLHMKMDEQIEDFNEELLKKTKEINRQLEINAKLMERLKKVTTP